MVGLIAADAAAQKSNTSGFMLNLHANGTSVTRPEIQGEKSDAESGGGYGARIGWGFTPKLTAFIGLDAAVLKFKGPNAPEGDYALGHFDLGLTYNFAGSSKQLVPYLEGAVSSRAIAFEADLGGGTKENWEQSGIGFSLGGGINYFFSRPWALNVGVLFTAGSFDDGKFGGTEVPETGGSANTLRVNLGVTWYPMKR